MSCPAKGIDSHIGFGGEVTHGTKGAIDLFMRILSHNVQHVKDPFMSESLDPGWHNDIFYSAGRNAGPIVFEMGYTGLELFLHSIMGTYTYSVDTPVAGANTHAFTHVPSTNSYPVGISAELIDGIGGTSEQSFHGLHVGKLTIEYANRQVLRITVDVFGTSTAFAAETSPTFAANKFVLPAHKSTLQIGGNDLTIISGNVEIELPRLADREHYGESLFKEACVGGRPTGKFSLLCEHNDGTGEDTEQLRQDYHDETELTGLRLTHEGDIITGATPYTFDINATKSFIVAGDPAVQDSGAVQLTIDGLITEGLSLSLINDTTQVT